MQQRCRLSEEGKNSGVDENHHDRIGVVVKESKSRNVWYVLWDGRSSSAPYHKSYIELIQK